MRWCPRRARREKWAMGLGWKFKETQKTQKEETQKKVLVGRRRPGLWKMRGERVLQNGGI